MKFFSQTSTWGDCSTNLFTRAVLEIAVCWVPWNILMLQISFWTEKPVNFSLILQAIIASLVRKVVKLYIGTSQHLSARSNLPQGSGLVPGRLPLRVRS